MDMGFGRGGWKESVCLEGLNIDVRIIFKSILNRMGRSGLDLFSSGQGQEAGSCESGNEPKGSIKC